MFLPTCSLRLCRFCLLHACGDVSGLDSWHPLCRRFAPRMWRCFYSRYTSVCTVRVCSTHVEMFLSPTLMPVSSGGLLHACGDVSRVAYFWEMGTGFAPRMWRCFYSFEIWSCSGLVCSTHVEMFPWRSLEMERRGCLLHACGDVSVKELRHRQPPEFAPRMWRCFSG